MAMAGLLAACQVVPKTGGPATPPPPTDPTDNVGPGLPTDTDRHRVALLVPKTGANADVGTAIANATTLALLDTRTERVRITTYDTALGAAAAARQAVADGNKRSEEHTSELQSLMRLSYAVFCLKKKTTHQTT